MNTTENTKIEALTWSEENDKIFSAFVKAQKEMSPLLKSSENSFFKSKYADLAAVYEACTDALNNNGIAHTAGNVASDTNGIEVLTVLVHESGQWMKSNCHIPAIKIDPQGYASANTYGRRIGLSNVCGLASQDDDGNAATRSGTQKTVEAPNPITKAQTSDIIALIGEAGFDPEQSVKAFEWASNGRTPNLRELYQPEAAKLAGFIKTKIS